MITPPTISLSKPEQEEINRIEVAIEASPRKTSGDWFIVPVSLDSSWRNNCPLKEAELIKRYEAAGWQLEIHYPPSVHGMAMSVKLSVL